MKYLKLFENFALNEKREPKSEVDHKALYKYLSPVLNKDGKGFDSEAYKKLQQSKGKKLDLSNFYKKLHLGGFRFEPFRGQKVSKEF